MGQMMYPVPYIPTVQYIAIDYLRKIGRSVQLKLYLKAIYIACVYQKDNIAS